jgi:glycerol-3-phosphate dehydrogenase
MGTLEKQKHGGALYRPAKGETRNPNGRPRKYVSTLKAQGYKHSEVMECMQVMLSMTLEELHEVFKNEKSTVLEKTIAGSLAKGLEKKSMFTIETLLSRIFGKPREQTEVSGSVVVHSIKLGKK